MQDSVTVEMAASPSLVWRTITDVTRIGEFSPETFEGEWLDGATGPAAGARFRGHVRRNGRGPVYWSTCRVVRCVPEREFAFHVNVRGRKLITWSYQLAPTDAGVAVTESYRLANSLGNRIYWSLAGRWRSRTNRDGMRTTLERVRAAVEVS